MATSYDDLIAEILKATEVDSGKSRRVVDEMKPIPKSQVQAPAASNGMPPSMPPPQGGGMPPMPPQIGGGGGTGAPPMPPQGGQPPMPPMPPQGGQAPGQPPMPPGVAPQGVRPQMSPNLARQPQQTQVKFPFESPKAMAMMERAKNADPRSPATMNMYTKRLQEEAIKIETEYQNAKQNSIHGQMVKADQNTWDTVYDMANELSGDPKASQRLADLAITSPKDASSILTQMAEKKYDTSKGTTINVPGQPMDIPNGFYPRDPKKWFAGDPTGGLMDLKDVSKGEQRAVDTVISSELVVDKLNQIRDVINSEEGLPATGWQGALVRMGTDALSPDVKEGDVPLLSSFTNAGEIDRLLEPVTSKIAIQTIGDMRKMSETGGALGNVSNFEVRMVQAAIDSLNPNRGKEEFLGALDNVETMFRRAAYLSMNGEDMSAEARKLGLDPARFMIEQLNKNFPLQEDFLKGMKFEKGNPYNIPGVDSTPPMPVDPNKSINIPTGNVRTYNPVTGRLE
jgi:hypothetical protein